MVTNFVVRFIFIWYIPASAKHTRLRSFFFALLEMLRRWQWNFCELDPVSSVRIVELIMRSSSGNRTPG